MRNSLSVSLVLFLLAGCAGSQQLQVDSSGGYSALAGKTLAVRTGKAGKLVTETPGKALLSPGLIAGALLYAASEDIAKKYNVPDPAARIGNTLADQLAARHGVRRAPEGGQADLELHVRTNDWKLVYGPVQWASYAPFIYVRAELKDARTGKRLAAGNCSFATAQTPRRSLEELFANNAALLKRDLETLADKCADQIAREML